MNPTNVLWFNLTDRKTLQSYNPTSDILNKERLLNAVQYLYSINLLTPTTVYILARHWAELTVSSNVS